MSARILLLGLLLAGCVINTRPHLPAAESADASPTAVGGGGGTDAESDNLRGDAGAARLDAPVGDLPVPQMCPDAGNCGATSFDASSVADAAATPADAATTLDATVGDAPGAVDGDVPRDAADDARDGGAPRDGAADAADGERLDGATGPDV